LPIIQAVGIVIEKVGAMRYSYFGRSIYMWCLLSGVLHGYTSYWYPVAQQQDMLWVIHQTVGGQLQLHRYYPMTGLLQKERYSFNQEMLRGYSVERFQLLPGNVGYSFLDNGRLRIKYADRHSPLSVDFLYPVYEMNDIAWINACKGVMSACYKEHFGLFYFMVDGRVAPIVWAQDKQYMHPQCANEWIYCVQKAQQQYAIVACKRSDPDIFHIPWHALSFDERSHMIMHATDQWIVPDEMSVEKHVFYSSDRWIGYLQFDEANAYCYFLHENVSENKEIVCVSWCCISLAIGHYQELFSFCIPKAFMSHHSGGLIESIWPLIPRRHKQTYYYSHYDEMLNALGLYAYDLTTSTSQLLIAGQETHYFAPCFYNDLLYYATTSH